MFTEDEGAFNFMENSYKEKPIRSDFTSFEDYEQNKVGRKQLRIEYFATANNNWWSFFIILINNLNSL